VKRILVVDDDRDIRQMLKLVLRQNGYRVFEADNGSRALFLAVNRKPDLIISDVMMDNINGFMLFELLRKERVTEHIPVILMTGAAQGVGAWGSEEHVGYLQKPVGIRQLLEEVERHI
jgi:DNA-binding response OmpR family regulator